MALTLIYQTLIIVLFLSFSFGPSFFALLNAAIKYGYKPGSFIAFGIFLSDLMVCLLIIFLVHLGATNFFHDEESKRFIGIVAGVLLIVFGAFHFKKQDVITELAIEIKTPAPTLMILKGFFLNTLNPAIWLLWLGNVTIISKTLNYSVVKMIFYFSLSNTVSKCTMPYFVLMIFFFGLLRISTTLSTRTTPSLRSTFASSLCVSCAGFR